MIQGSPERTIARAVVESDEGALFLVEKFPASRFQVRDRVAQAVHYLKKNGLKEALSYLKTGQGEFLPFYEDHCFGITPFVASTVLERPAYLKSAGMGEMFAAFMIHMDSASMGIEDQVQLDSFSIKDYVAGLFSKMKRHDPSVYSKFLPFLDFLKKSFWGEHDNLPIGFCHGDLHPLNVIWDGEEIKAVIDWEFAGIKPRIHDAANLVGCAGIEQPEGLVGPLVMNFLNRMSESLIYNEEEWCMLPEYVLALRFGWLSEWLRKKDREMIEMEAAFMKILMDNMDELKSGWGLYQYKGSRR